SKVYLQKISNAGEKHPLYGIGHSLKSRKKMSLSRMGPKNHRYGTKLPEWHKQKLLEGLKKVKRGTYKEIYGEKKAKEIKNKISQARKG
ncbi:unnamed protein product, partial [marine sediment metagenome]